MTAPTASWLVTAKTLNLYPTRWGGPVGDYGLATDALVLAMPRYPSRRR
jgi:hypothetical protein